MSRRRIKDIDPESAVEILGNQTVVGLGWKIGGAIVAISLLVGCVGFVGGWFKTAVDVVSPKNVTEQWQFAYDYDRSLTAIAVQWCSMQKAEDAATDPDAKNQRISQRLAMETNYERVRAQYDARLADAFRAKLVAPPDVPDKAPTLQQQVNRARCYP